MLVVLVSCVTVYQDCILYPCMYQDAGLNVWCIRIVGLYPISMYISGCGPECLVDPDCRFGFICSERKCVEKPDPCVPNPCGEGAVCILQGDSFSCECPAGTVGTGNTGRSS